MAYQFTPTYTSTAGRPGDLTWRDNCDRLYRYMRRDMSDAESQRKIYYPKTWAEMVPRTIPLIHRIARELGTALYLLPPSRELRQAGEPLDVSAQESVRRSYVAMQIDARWRTAHEHLITLRQAVVWAWGPSQVLVVPPHHHWVRFRSPLRWDEDNLLAVYVAIPFRLDDTSGAMEWGIAEITPTTATWTQGPLRGRGVWDTEGVANPLGRIPVCMLRAADPEPGSWWVDLPLDRLEAQRAVNMDATDIGHVARLTSYGQKWRKGSGVDSDEIEEGPEYWINIKDPQGAIGIESNNANLSGYQGVADAYLDSIVGNEGLNPSAYKRSAGVTALAKLIELADREPERLRHAEQFRLAEQRMYGLLRDWQGVDDGNGVQEVWPEAEVVVGYRQLPPPVDPLHRAQQLQMHVALGRESVVRDVSEQRGIPLDEARQIVADNIDDTLAVQERLGVTNPSPAPTEPAVVPTDAEMEPEETAPEPVP